jgi:hypothetical protein
MGDRARLDRKPNDPAFTDPGIDGGVACQDLAISAGEAGAIGRTSRLA